MKKRILNATVGLIAFLVGTYAIYISLPEYFSIFTLPESRDVEVDDSRPHFVVQNDVPGTQKSDLFVFVGEKREVIEFIPPEGEYWFDQAFDAKYKVVEKVYGEFEGNIIEFRAFDHYGYPPFARTKHALLFVSKYPGKHQQDLFHQKYQYYDVYQTVDGRWASCGDPYRGMDYHRKPFEPKPLEFAEPVIMERNNLTSKQFAEFYPSPYFERDGKHAICKMGAYVDELFQIKKDGVLKARGVGQN